MPKARDGLGGRTGSSTASVEYLSKKDVGNFFSQKEDTINASEVINHLDRNKRGLCNDDDKYYHVIVTPSQNELNAIGNDPKKLKEYTREFMDRYAENFGKGLKGKDLAWYAVIDHDRTFKASDPEVREGLAKVGDEKPGDQRHVHILVSRTENLDVYREKKAAGETLNEKGKDRKPYLLSPQTNHQNTTEGAVKGGFCRNNLYREAEQTFDQMFEYKRPLRETFEARKTLKLGTLDEKLEMRRAISREDDRDNFTSSSGGTLSAVVDKIEAKKAFEKALAEIGKVTHPETFRTSNQPKEAEPPIEHPEQIRREVEKQQMQEPLTPAPVAPSVKPKKEVQQERENKPRL